MRIRTKGRSRKTLEKLAWKILESKEKTWKKAKIMARNKRLWCKFVYDQSVFCNW